MPKEKIIVTGFCSSGTTFAVGLLGLLGHDTGYSEEVILDHYRGHSLEVMEGDHDKYKRRAQRVTWRRERVDLSPKVIKQPITYHGTLINHIVQYEWELEHVFLMVRSAEGITAGRERRAASSGYDQNQQYPYLWNLLELLAERATQIHTVHFPLVVEDVEYAHRAFAPLSGDFDKFEVVWRKWAQPGLKSMSKSEYRRTKEIAPDSL
jgi:hypothetical protein